MWMMDLETKYFGLRALECGTISEDVDSGKRISNIVSAMQLCEIQDMEVVSKQSLRA